MDADTRINKALDFISSYGQIDGNHHKLWVIDQVVRALIPTAEAYRDWVEKYERGDSQDGTYEYDWDIGIAP